MGIEQWIFLHYSSILRWKIGGVAVNKFEENVQYKGNDAVDSGIGFVVGFIFFTSIFVLGTAIELLGK